MNARHYSTTPSHLTTPHQITSLDLHSCDIHDSGAAALAKAVGKNTVLTTLNLRANYITDAALPVGMVSASSACLTPAVLTCLPRAVFEALADNSTLTCVNLRSNDFSAAGEAALAKFIATHPSVASTGTAGASLESIGCVIA